MHIMIDLETMGTRPNAPVVSVGAVRFDGTGITGEFYEKVDLNSAVRAGAVIDPATVGWWLKQSEDARMELASGGADISVVLATFSLFCRGPEVVGIWGNGVGFDNVILQETAARLDMAPLWPFWKDRCYRTVKNLFPDIPMDRSGTHHNALDDAKSQALHLIEISAAHGDFL